MEKFQKNCFPLITHAWERVIFSQYFQVTLYCAVITLLKTKSGHARLQNAKIFEEFHSAAVVVHIKSSFQTSNKWQWNEMKQETVYMPFVSPFFSLSLLLHTQL